MNREEIKNKINSLTGELLPEIIHWRRHIHSHPELSFNEYKTTDYIESILRKEGITDITKLAETGLVAIIQGEIEPNSRVFGLRADIDALPITELNEIDYKSHHEGVMHACGHDVHTSSLLGTATILNRLKKNIKGTVKLVFQHAEEKMPGGACQLIEKGVLKNPEVNTMIGQHVYPFLKAGQLGFRSGMYMASCDELHITIKGKGGHGALPDMVVDPVLVSSHVIIALQQVVSRNARPKDPTVLSIGKVTANGATNIIPDEVRLEGTFRAMNEDWRNKAHIRIEETINGICAAMGASAEINIVKGYPFLENNPEYTTHIRTLAEEFLGEENVIDLDIWMGGEDFSYYTHEVPACFYRFGTSSPKGEFTSPVHTATFNIDENALKTSAAFMAYSVLAS